MAISRVGYSAKVLIVCILCLTDLLLNGSADFADAEDWFAFMFVGVQLLIQLLNFLMIFMLFFGTYLFQVGLIGVLVREFKGMLYLLPIYAAVYIAYAACKLALLSEKGSVNELWHEPVFIFLSILQKIGATIYYLALWRTVYRLGEVQWYSRLPWVNKFSSTNISNAARV